jgi:hypothetical protein
MANSGVKIAELDGQNRCEAERSIRGDQGGAVRAVGQLNRSFSFDFSSGLLRRADCGGRFVRGRWFRLVRLLFPHK